MSDAVILNKEHLTSFLRKIAKEHELLAPVKNAHGDTVFDIITSVDDASLDLKSKPVMPPKNLFLPRIELLFKYERERGKYRFQEVLPDMDRVLFGLRSCDLWAILFLDVVFQENFKDRYYLNRRSNTMLINVGCREPMKSCFCKSAKSGPFLVQGYDLQFTDLGNRFFIEIGRPKGKELVEKWSYFFEPATQKDRDEQYEVVLEAESAFGQIVDFDTATSRLINDEVEEALWEELGNRCQGCGGCAYVCPTCYCFNIIDQAVSDTKGERIRTPDACTLAGFTRLAGGYNPRHERRRRIRRRFLHKLAYAKDKYYRPSCVGCGRCVEICCGGVDMFHFIKVVCERGERSKKVALTLGEILLNAGLISKEELEMAMEKQLSTGKSLGAQLIDDGLVTRSEIAHALSIQLGLPETAGTGGLVER